MNINNDCAHTNTNPNPNKTIVLLSPGFVLFSIIICLTFAVAYDLSHRRTKKKLHSLKDCLRQIADETSPQTILNAQCLRKICGTLPKWVDFSDYHRVPWLNKAIKVMWPFLDKAIASSVIWALSDVVNDLAKMSKLKIGFGHWTLGDEPPIFTALKVLDDLDSEVTLDLEFKWVAVKPEVVLDVKVGGITLPIKLEHIEAFGVVRVVFTPLVPWWPTFDGLKIAFVEKPNIDFSLKLIGGDINTIPFVANSLRHLITNSLVDLMVWPQKIWVPMGETWERENRNISGLLKIVVQNAEDLVVGSNVIERGVSAMTSLKSFVAVDLNQKNTHTKYTEAKPGRSPQYDEQISLRVDDIRYSKIRFTVYNSSVVGRILQGQNKTELLHSEIGFALCDLNGFQMKDVNKPLSLTLDIEKPEIHGVASRSTQVAKAVLYSPLTILSVGVKGAAAVGRRVANIEKVEKKDTCGKLFVTLQYLPFADRNAAEETTATTTTAQTTTTATKENNNNNNNNNETIASPLSTTTVLNKNREYTGVLYARVIRADALRAARGINPDPYVKIRFGKQKRKTRTRIDTRCPTWEEEFEFIVDTAEASRSSIEVQVLDRAPLGRRQSLGTLKLHSGDILAQCLRVFKDTGAEYMEKKFELANVPCGTLMMQFEFISVSQAPALETDIEEAKVALIKTELKRLKTEKRKVEKEEEERSEKGIDKTPRSKEIPSASIVPTEFEWRQSSPGKMISREIDETPALKKQKKPLGRRIASVFRSKEEKERKKREKERIRREEIEASYKEDDYEEEEDSISADEVDDDNVLEPALQVVLEEEGEGIGAMKAKLIHRKSLHIDIAELNKVKMGSPVSEHESVIQKRKAYYRASSKFGDSNETLKFKSALDEVLEKEEAKKKMHHQQQSFHSVQSPRSPPRMPNHKMSSSTFDSRKDSINSKKSDVVSDTSADYSSGSSITSFGSDESGMSELSSVNTSDDDADYGDDDPLIQKKRSRLRKALRRMKRELGGKAKHDKKYDKEFYDKKQAELDAEKKMERAVPGYEWRTKNQAWKQKNPDEYVQMRGASKAKRIEDLRQPTLKISSSSRNKNDAMGWEKVV